MPQQTVVCVGAVVKQADRVLLVRQAAGHSLAGQWTIPWGRLEPGESPAQAAVRETAEEGGISAEIEGLLGVQELPPPWEGWFALVYQCRHLDGEPSGDGHETDAAHYFDIADFEALSEPIEAWSQWLVRRVLCGQSTLITASASPFASSGFL